MKINKLLIVVDMQNDFITGPLGTPEAREAAGKAAEKVRSAGQDPNTKVLFTQDTHGSDYFHTKEGQNLPVAHCVQNTKGWELIPPLGVMAAKLPQNRVVPKNTFGSKDLVKAVEGIMKENPISQIELIGVCTDICVISNALLLKAYFPEIDFVVDASCCAGVTKEAHNAALTVLKSCQIKVLM